MVLFFTFFVIPQHLYAQDYEMIDLGSFCFATSINSQGNVAGYCWSWEEYNYYPFLWTEKDGMRNLGTLVGGSWGVAYGINNRGGIVGYGETASGKYHAFVWTENEGMRDLGDLGGGESQAWGINDRGQIIGWSLLPEYPEKHRAFLWTKKDGMRDLGTLGGLRSIPYAINNRGEIVGISENASDESHAFIWTEKDGMADLGLGGNSFANDINDAGQVVGRRTDELAHPKGYLWTKKDGVIDLGMFDPQVINNRGETAGNTIGLNPGDDAILRTKKGVLIDLGALGGHISFPWDINEHRQIVGNSIDEIGRSHAILWTK